MAPRVPWLEVGARCVRVRLVGAASRGRSAHTSVLAAFLLICDCTRRGRHGVASGVLSSSVPGLLVFRVSGARLLVSTRRLREQFPHQKFFFGVKHTPLVLEQVFSNERGEAQNRAHLPSTIAARAPLLWHSLHLHRRPTHPFATLA